MRPSALFRLAGITFASVLLWVAPAASAVPITIDPGAYTGRYYVLPAPGLLHGSHTVNLADGRYTVETGSSVGTAYGSSYFLVDIAGGQITGVSNPAAAQATTPTTLTFHNTTVSVQTGAYTGSYFPSSSYPAQSQGPHDFVLVPALVYHIDTGAHIVATIDGTLYASDFLFSLDASGNVTIIPGPGAAPATAAGHVITLNSVPVLIDPGGYAGPYRTAGSNLQNISGTQTVQTVPGLVTFVNEMTTNGVGYFVASSTDVRPSILPVGAYTFGLAFGQVTGATLAAMTRTFVQGSSRYAGLGPIQRTVVDALVTAVSQGLVTLTAASTPAQKAAIVGAYGRGVDVLVGGGWLTPAQGSLLKAQAATL